MFVIPTHRPLLFTGAMAMALAACAADAPLLTTTASGGQEVFSFGEPAEVG